MKKWLFFLIKENNYFIFERFHISLESRNNKRSTLLIFAVQCGYDIFVKYLLEKGANINAQDFELNTALHYALSHNNFNFADILLKNGANERLMNNSGLTPWQMMTYRDFNNWENFFFLFFPFFSILFYFFYYIDRFIIVILFIVLYLN